MNAAIQGLRSFWQPGYPLANAGVMLLDLQPDTVQQGELMLEGEEQQVSARLMHALDAINDKFGKGSNSNHPRGHDRPASPQARAGTTQDP